VQETPALAADPYPYTLWVYDLETAQNTALMDLRVPDIVPSRTSEILYVKYYETDDMGRTGTRTTYLLPMGE